MNIVRTAIVDVLEKLVDEHGFREVIDALADLAIQTGDAELFGDQAIVDKARWLSRELIKIARKVELDI